MEPTKQPFSDPTAQRALLDSPDCLPPKPTFPYTDHNCIIMGTVDPQHHSCVGVLGPSLWQDCFPFIPHPANKVLKSCFLGDVIEAGRDRHVQGWARLEKEVESCAGDVAQLVELWPTMD